MDYEKKYNEALKRARAYNTPIANRNTKAILESVFPELADSEDERIRKYLIDELKVAKSVGELKFTIPQPTREECIAYLEKQKEQKPIKWNEEDENIRKQLISICDEWLSGGYNARPCLDDVRWLKNLLENQKEPTTVEWNEEDKDYYDTIVRKLEVIGDDSGLSSNQIKFLREHCPPHCLEWSEEDETIIEGACNALEIYGHTKLASRLKSLRTHTYWKPSELEKVALRTAIRILTDERNFPKAAAQLQNILDAFEGKESRKDWKPSDEQMNYLCAAVDAAIRKHNESVSGYEPARVLKSLYEDLKNLT